MDILGSPDISRRGFLNAAVGAGLLTVAPVVSGCGRAGERPLDDQWLFGQFTDGAIDVHFDESGLTPVSLPHCVAALSWWKWNPNAWNGKWVYRRHLPAPDGPRTVVHFAGVLSTARVYLNGHQLGNRTSGYLPFDFELTPWLHRGDNVLAVVVDSRWGLDVPPERPKPWRAQSIDYYQAGGITRPVAVRELPHRYVEDVFAKPVDVLTPTRRLEVTGQLDSSRPVAGQVVLVAQLLDGDDVVAEASTSVPGQRTGKVPFSLDLTGLEQVRLWDVDDPYLYRLRVRALVSGQLVHQETVRFGFREARFTRDGFFLNGRRVQLFGLGRHELFPYVGPAMPDRVQRKDAELLKNELNCAMVRCACYPQSEAFLDACDELGLLVWCESPGWDYIGNQQWRDQVLDDVRTLVRRDRNHPSVVVWGTRLNETEDLVSLYSKTRELAQQWDGTRATTGAVNSTITTPSPPIPRRYRDPYAVTYQVQDVFSLNDYLRPPPGRLPTLRPPSTQLPYLVSEAVGALTGPPRYRRTDPVEVQAEQAMLHAAVHDKAMSDPRYCGVLAWSAFDYPSGHGEQADQVKWTGVLDIFRVPKLGAAFYRAQVDPAVRPVIEPAFRWGPEGPGEGAVIWSNCERLTVFRVRGGGPGQLLADARPDRSLLPHLSYPPFVVDLPRDAEGDLRVDGWVGGKRVLSRSMSADRSRDQLLVRPDDLHLAAGEVDATRVVLGVADRYGNWRASSEGPVRFSVRGPGELVGDNPLDVAGNGGVGAVWIRSTGRPGDIRLSVDHEVFGHREIGFHVG